LGRDLLAAVSAHARSLGAAHVTGRHAGAAGAAFAAAVGAAPGNSQAVSVLTLPATIVPRPVAGYTLRSWTGRAPGELVVSYARARNAIADAPHSAGFAEAPWTVEVVRDIEEALLRQGREQRVTVALDGGGEVAGYTEVRVGPEPGAVAGVDDTAVTAAHRGRGLATWIKQESMRLLAADRADVTTVTTSNDVTNGPMLAVNRRLGFTRVSTWTDAVLTLG
ncbi:GNAT family N-acetyltransferase, partial [Microbispora sp. ATCC PTA-5024]|uniref:GNAT family N-acetyltransferase n=1 Tax=Microbispora sp. ATCC PTA-5024 TaxID=316330 RepID=UPI0003DC4A76